MLAIVLLLTVYAAVVALFSATSFDRTVARGDEKFYCGLDCHIADSVRNVEHTKTIGDTRLASASGEFYVIAVRSHFDKRTIGPRRGDRPLGPDPPTLTLMDGSGHSYPVSSAGRRPGRRRMARLLRWASRYAREKGSRRRGSSTCPRRLRISARLPDGMDFPRTYD